MKTLLRSFVVLFCASIFLSASAQDAGQLDPGKLDGNWWRGQNQAFKFSYMVGFFNGMELGNKFSYWKFSNDKTATNSVDLVNESYTEYLNKYFKNVSNAQIADGLDAFYADFRNRSILVHNAIWLVTNQIAGVPTEKVNAMIESWRKNSKR